MSITPITGPYIEKRRQEVKAYTLERHAELRKSEIVAALLENCESPKTWAQMMAFINERMKISDPHLKKTVIKPFLAEGEMERCQVEGEGRRYYYRLIKYE